MDNNIKALSPWLECLPFDWTSLEEHGQSQEYKKHEHLYYHEESSDYIYIVKNGRVRLYLTSFDGREKAMAVVGKNGLLGECSIRPRQHYLTGAVTAAPSTIIKIGANTFEKLVLANQHLTVQWIEMLSMKLQLLTYSSLQLSYGSSYIRLCDAFIHLALTYGELKKDGSILITITFTHQELAELIGTTRVTVVNSLKELDNKNMIKKDGRSYTIPNIQTLYTYIHGHTQFN